jgi:hypothetical protein
MFILSKFSALIYEMASNPQSKMKDGGTIKSNKLLAPNGQPSNLPPKQYHLVRTPAFKAWFGDWEKDPTNASKVVDENGEPMVVYHGTVSQHNIFRVGDEGGVFFTESKRLAESYAAFVSFGKMVKTANQNPKLYSVFLNCRNLKDLNLYGKLVQRLKVRFESLKRKGADGIRIINGMDFGDPSGMWNQYVAFEPNQIKLADGTNTTFDTTSPDIRFADGGQIINEEALQYIDIIAMNPNLEAYQKYKEILKTKFGIDFDSIYKDQQYIENASIDNIKTQNDFLDFQNWLTYAKKISQMRGFVSMDDYSTPSTIKPITDKTWKEVSQKLGFEIKKVDYVETGNSSGDIARAMGNTIIYTEMADLYYMLHEIGHIYDFRNQVQGIAKNPAFSPTRYGTTLSGETFAENFAIYFINPAVLRKWNKQVYDAVDIAINDTYKKVLRNLVNEYQGNSQNIRYSEGGEVLKATETPIAPNGKPSNLSPHQYALVRTPAFKKWFGDWEHDPAKSSKVVDENGEPMVVYHATLNDFDEFDVGSEMGSHFGNIKQAHSISFRKNGNFFYKYDQNTPRGQSIIPVYLNIKNPIRVSDIGSFSDTNRLRDELIDAGVKIDGRDLYADELKAILKEQGYDGIVYINKLEGLIGGFRRKPSGDSWIAFDPQQSKSSISNTTFDPNTPDIRFKDGGEA